MTTTDIQGKEPSLLRFMPDVTEYRQNIKALSRQWIRISLTGKINSNRVAATLIDFMEKTQSKFLLLQEDLICALTREKCDKIAQEMAGLSQVAIDILKRNLFERTADVGFLATDDDIVHFLCTEASQEQDVRRIEERLQAYRDNYTVYDEIVVFDIFGNVRAHMDKSSPITASADPLLRQTLATDGYLETFRACDIRPNQDTALVYSQRILQPETGQPLGVLCLCFDFKGEMNDIYKNLLQNKSAVICILNDKGLVISSSDPKRIALGCRQTMSVNDGVQVIQHQGEPYLARTAQTNGYQGFVGLPWFGHVMYPVNRAFTRLSPQTGSALHNARDTKLFSGSLRKIDNDADDILNDLELVVLNGEVMAAKQIVNADQTICQEANALPPVLSAIHQVGETIRGVFSASISSLLNTVISSKQDDIQFSASLAIDIMDRNLYERANDCRWWALNSSFRRLLAKDTLENTEKRRLHEILAYINSLYTVYVNLILYDKAGTVVATAAPASTGLVGKKLQNDSVHDCLRLQMSQLYCVSNFEKFEGYASANGKPRPTYIYNAAIFHPDVATQVVGGIAIVFDSEPQFSAMLYDALPRDEEGSPQKGSLGFFVTRERQIISATDSQWEIGETLPIDGNILRLKNGEQRSDIISLNNQQYLIGCAMSNGYREYKRDGKYTNDVIAAILLEI